MPTQFEVSRDQNGVPHVTARSMAGMWMGQGSVHALDRGMQLLLMRILGQGRACEFLDASDDMLAVDTFFRRMNWRGGARETLEALSDDIRGYLAAYCDGINAGLQRKAPWELRLLGYRPDPWQSDRRFSKWYVSDLANWQAGRYKTVSPDNDPQGRPFP